jgi:hypothetical protein
LKLDADHAWWLLSVRVKRVCGRNGGNSVEMDNGGGSVYLELMKNLPSHPDWCSSFYGKLAEDGEWNVDAFWRLHVDLLQIAKDFHNEECISRELLYALIYVQNGVLNSIVYNLSKKDAFKIINIDENSIMKFKERFDSAMICIGAGDILPETSFDLVNPLL